MIDTIMGWFKITEYEKSCDKKNLVKNMRLTRYIWPTKKRYEQASKFIGNEFRNYKIEK